MPNGEFVADSKVNPNSIKVTYFVLSWPERQGCCFHTPGPYCLERRTIKHARNDVPGRQILFLFLLCPTASPSRIFLLELLWKEKLSSLFLPLSISLVPKHAQVSSLPVLLPLFPKLLCQVWSCLVNEPRSYRDEFVHPETLAIVKYSIMKSPPSYEDLIYMCEGQ